MVCVGITNPQNIIWEDTERKNTENCSPTAISPPYIDTLKYNTSFKYFYLNSTMKHRKVLIT